jgi:transcriptional regulator with XRE-family HTH domain
MNLGKHIRQARKLKNLNQEECAELLGIKQGYLSNLEANKREPSLAMLVTIKKKLETSYDKLLEGK